MPRIGVKLPIPLSFYDDLTQQNRYKAQCVGYTHNEYAIVNGCRLLPFQFKLKTERTADSNDLELFLVNVSTAAETDLTSLIDSSEWDVVSDGTYLYITYFGNQSLTVLGVCPFADCLYYLRMELTIVGDTSSFYSELFQVYNVGEVEETNLIEWDEGQALKHDSAADDRLKHNS